MKKSFLKRKPQSEEMSLQITAMADIFTVILVFLLKGYSTSVANITPTQGMQLPVAFQAPPAVEALKVEISENAIQIEGTPVSNLKAFALDPADLQGNGTSKKLLETFERERKRQLLIAQANSDVKIDPKIIVVADQKVPYSTLKTVLASAAVHGYTDFKLAVVSGD